MSLQVIVDYGPEHPKRRANAPEGSLIQKRIISRPLDDHPYQSDYYGTGWYRWLEDEKWFHLGGNTKGEPTIYVLKLRRKKGVSNDTPLEWLWSKHTDQSRAEELYEKYGKQPVE